jgi:conjugative relaxase-like TrwC/TraI family protein
VKSTHGLRGVARVLARPRVRRLGLHGSVEPRELRRALIGVSPNGEILTAGRVDEASRVAGSDLTWSAPKSVSLLFGLSVPGVTAIIRGVHKDAVDKRSATSIVMPSKLRRAAGGQNSVAAEGLVAAASRIGPRRPNPSTQLVAATERSTLDPT